MNPDLKPLTFRNFFPHLINHPKDAIEDDRDWTWAASITLGIFTLGLVHAGCAIAEKCFTPKDKGEDDQLMRVDAVREAKLYTYTGKADDTSKKESVEEEGRIGAAFKGMLHKMKSAFTGVALKDCPLASRIAFGKADWETIYGEIGEEPSLPGNIEEVLNADCKIFPGKKVHETHILVLVPEKVRVDGNEVILDLESLGELVKNPKAGSGGHSSRALFGSIPDKLKMKSASSHWVLMTKEPMQAPNEDPDYIKVFGQGDMQSSCGRSYEYQVKMVKKMAAKTGIPYEVPSARDVAICFFMHYAKTGERLCDCSQDPNTTSLRAVCVEKDGKVQAKSMNAEGDPLVPVENNVVVGQFSHKGLAIEDGYFGPRGSTFSGASYYGMFPAWKL